jgi:hypothetical protein
MSHKARIAGADVMEKTQRGMVVRIRLLAIVLILVFVGAFIFFTLDHDLFRPRDVSIGELYAHPSEHIGQRVNAVGYLVKYITPRLGDDYRLYEGDPRNLYFAVNPSIAVSGESSAADRHISFTYDGSKYMAAPSPCSFAFPCRVAVTGVFTNRGAVADVSQYVIEASSFAWHE